MQLIGHDWAREYLIRQEQKNKLRQSYLLLGAPSIGKTTLAISFAMYLSCQATEQRPCGVCRSCQRISAGFHPDVSIIEPAGETLTIDQVRQLQAELPLTPKENRLKVRILSDFHLASREAQNALLKTLEEPPAHALLFLTTSEPNMLLPTIISRCQSLTLKPVATKAIEAALITQGLERTKAADLAAQSAGRPGWALRAAAQPALAERRACAFSAMRTILSQSMSERLQQAQTISQVDRAEVLETLRLWQLWWHDWLLASSDSENGSALAKSERVKPPADLAPAQAAACLRQLCEIENLVERNANLRLALDVLMLRLPQFSPEPRQ